jgi:hypothetical protein
MCGLSPIELAWSKVKNYVHENNVTGDVFEAAAGLKNRRDC